MLRRSILSVLLLAAVSHASAALSRFELMQAAQRSATDNISSGWCGRGMLSILKSSGLGEGLQGANGQDWEKNLAAAGWKPVRCLSPQKAPLGAVLVYLGDSRVGKRPRGTPGGYHGHVEMVALDRTGGRLYVSDSPRKLPGGTVPDNFTGRAWLPPGSARFVSIVPPLETQVNVVLEERKKMAFDYFARKETKPSQPSIPLVSQDIAKVDAGG